MAAYGRVSTLDQHADIQVEAIRRAAAERGWNIVAEHLDDGVSGIATFRGATSITGRLLTQVLACFAAYERDMIRMRVQAGVDRARANGIHCGRLRVELDLRPAVAMLNDGYGCKAIAKAFGVSRTTLRRKLREAGHSTNTPTPRASTSAPVSRGTPGVPGRPKCARDRVLAAQSRRPATLGADRDL